VVGDALFLAVFCPFAGGEAAEGTARPVFVNRDNVSLNARYMCFMCKI
jgi:hypothetical protein